MKAFPDSFVRSLSTLLGPEAEPLLAALSAEPPVSVRFNPFKTPAIAHYAFPCPSARVPWASDACYLPERLPFTFDPLFHAGAYYVQEASSMFVGRALQQVATRSLRMLDLCAAPGGKSTLYRALLPAGSILVANDPIPNRARVLAENLAKWGHPDVVVTNNYPADFAPALKNFFDVVAVDAPCSGEGMFRKDAGAVDEWSESNVTMCCGRQREIVRDIWPTLRPGGYLFYSTCTYNLRENEENVAWMVENLGAEPVALPIEPTWGVAGNLLPGSENPVFRFFPHRVRGEGFFFALLRKKGEAREATPDDSRRRREEKRTVGVPAACKEWVSSPADFGWELTNGVVSAVPTHLVNDVAALRRARLRLLAAGVAVAEEKGRKWLPLPSLALSKAFRIEAFPCVEVAYAEALAYLRGEALTLPAGVPRGMVCLTYRNVPLGFANNLGNRANNLYPDAWRIRSGHFPAEPPRVC